MYKSKIIEVYENNTSLIDYDKNEAQSFRVFQ